jgi:hypothetical protein
LVARLWLPPDPILSDKVCAAAVPAATGMQQPNAITRAAIRAHRFSPGILPILRSEAVAVS